MVTPPYEDVLLVRFDTPGSVMWSRRYDVQGSLDVGYHLTIDLPPNPNLKGFDFVVSGYARTNLLSGSPTYTDDGLLLRARSQAGAPATAEVFGGPSDEVLYDVLTNGDGFPVAMGGNSSYFPPRRAWLVERYDTIAHACHDDRVVPGNVPVKLPDMDPLVAPLPKAFHPEVPITEDHPVKIEDVCPKVPWVGVAPPLGAKKAKPGVDAGNQPPCR